MRLRIKKNDMVKHNEIATSVSWTVNNDLYR